MAHRSDEELIRDTRNAARYFTENRHVSWVAMVAVLIWGVYGYQNMPKRKDPRIPVNIALVSCPWPGIEAIRVEQLVTRAIEEKIAESTALHDPQPGNAYAIKSLTLPGLAILNVQLDDAAPDKRAAFDDIALKLDELNAKLPAGAGPIHFDGDFGETSTLMLSVASPVEDAVGISLRARALESAIRAARADAADGERATLAVAFPRGVPAAAVTRYLHMLSAELEKTGIARDRRPILEPGLAALDVAVSGGDAGLLAFARRFTREQLGAPTFHPDAWEPVVVRDPADAESQLARVAGARYSYAELDDASDLIARALTNLAPVAKVDRSGVLPEEILLEYSQDQLAAYGLVPANIRDVLAARNISLGGGVLQVGAANVQVDPSGAFRSPEEIGDVMIARADGAPVYLRDLVDVVPGYQSPPQTLQFLGRPGPDGGWLRTRAITLSVIMRAGEQVERFGAAVDAALEALRPRLPEGLVLARTSDQPRQVRENLALFMEALYEAVALVVVVALLGFWEWRSALLMALAIPLTLAMTFGATYALGVELQQVSVAALIIALGLLVDDPVVAGDAIKRQLAEGRSRLVAAWLGPTKLAHAIFFATLTNVIAYLPFLMLPGNSGMFVHSLPIVMSCALVSSRLVSMSFVPMLGYYLLRAPDRPEPPIEERRRRGFTGLYFRIGCHAIEHRWAWAGASLIFLVLGAGVASRLDTSFFPEDVQYLSYVDVWLPTDAPLASTEAAAEQVEQVIRDVIRRYAEGEDRQVLERVASFVGSGSPRFWFSLVPQPQQLNYAQLVIEVSDKDDTPRLVAPLQRALDAEIPGAQVEVHQLQTNPVGHPIEIQIQSRAPIDPRDEAADIAVLREFGGEVEAILRAVPEAGVVRSDWMDEAFAMRLRVDPDRANLAGVTNLDVAVSAGGGISGSQVTTLLRGNRQIPVVTRLRSEERAELGDLQSLYVFATEDRNKVPLLEVASLDWGLETQRIARREHFRTLTVEATPAPGELASVVLGAAQPELDRLVASLPPGYSLQFGGERFKQHKGNRNLSVVLAISAAGIFLALVLQFNHAFKPLLVFSAVPFGAVGALTALYLTGESFGFMAFLGIIALIGVIVSHVIVLFDFIERNRERGEPLRESLLDAGIVRLRPILITVGATVLALFPLAIHGGPLWRPLCYAQIGGLTLATFIELLLVKVFYAISVLDLKLIRWPPPTPCPSAAPSTGS